jgi:hypothetical protein
MLISVGTAHYLERSVLMWTFFQGLRQLTTTALKLVGLEKPRPEHKAVSHPVRPAAVKTADREALRRDLMKRFSKTLAELAK